MVWTIFDTHQLGVVLNSAVDVKVFDVDGTNVKMASLVLGIMRSGQLSLSWRRARALCVLSCFGPKLDKSTARRCVDLSRGTQLDAQQIVWG